MDVKSGERYSYSYIIGTIHVEFMDDDEDLISTNKQSVIWDGPHIEVLRDSCTKRIRKASLDLMECRRR